ncbi:MAG: TraR/DksA C4-type zinc finger protein [Synergistales bacterium]|nr:TraR/DksA C4-type zinc finger protein [Synergistales bacterium]
MHVQTLTPEQIDYARTFHGHWCPGLAMGLRIAERALATVGPSGGDEEVVAVAECDNCSVDAIQALLGCTFGKGNLLHRDYGKTAFSFYRRSDGYAERIVATPPAGAQEGSHAERAAAIMAAPLEEAVAVGPAGEPMPFRASLYRSAPCEECGEPVMEPRLRCLGGRRLCIPCFHKVLERGRLHENNT